MTDKEKIKEAKEETNGNEKPTKKELENAGFSVESVYKNSAEVWCIRAEMSISVYIFIQYFPDCGELVVSTGSHRLPILGIHTKDELNKALYF